MALIMPGTLRGTKIVAASEVLPKTIFEKELDERAGALPELPALEPELGPSGVPDHPDFPDDKT
jgi:hypothetical protein